MKCSNCIGGSVVSIQNAGNIRFENFVLDGGGNTSSGLTLDHVTRSEINNVRVRNVIQKGFYFHFNVLNTFTNPKVTDAFEVGLISMPVFSMQIDGASSANTIINPVFEGHQIAQSLTPSNAVGLKFSGIAVQNVIVGGTVEGLNDGIVLGGDAADSDCSKNTFNGIDLEGNSGNDIIVDAGHANQFNNIIAISKSMPKNVELRSRSRANTFVGGSYSSILERGQYNSFIGIEVSKYNQSTFDSYLISTMLLNVRDNSLTSPKSFSRLPNNILVGQFGGALQNIYTFTTNTLSPPAPVSVPGTVKQSIYVDSNISTSAAAGASVSVSYVGGNFPDNYILSGHVDPNSPQSVVIRWTQLYGTPIMPPQGVYKITVLQ